MSDEDGWDSPVGEMSKKLFMVVFGAPNVGKTILTSRIALHSGKSLIITDEKGHLALKDFPDLEANTRVKNYQSRNTIREAIQRRRSGQSEFDTLIFDTFTGIQKVELSIGMMETLPNGQPNPRFLDVKRFHSEIPVTQDYLLSENTWRPIINALATQDEFNVILNCHLQHPNPEKFVPGDKTRPKLPDAIWQLVNGKANVVAYMDKSSPTDRYLQCVSTNTIAGKSQIKSLNEPRRFTDDEFVERVIEWQFT